MYAVLTAKISKKIPVFDDMDLSSSDEELIAEINDALVRFIKSEETQLQLEPMNSFRRRMVHKIGTKYKLTSESTGEGINRSVSLRKTELSEIPEKMMQNNSIIAQRLEEEKYNKMVIFCKKKSKLNLIKYHCIQILKLNL